jgi:hypothetical protein|tara:strand:- start:86 stop:1651 length:1566 start_codon:yes stop_codon:yes gene_type:complete
VAVDDFDDGYGDPSDYGMSQSDFDTATSIGQAVYSGNDDNIAQAIANATAQPRVGSNRSNITNLVDSSGNSLYDPQFAAALDITRGLDPTNNFGGTGGLAVPSYLRPQLTGANYVDYGDQDIYFDGPRDKVKYFSPVERFLQEDATNFIRSAQESAAGIPSLLSTGVGLIKNVFDGLSFLNDSKAGKTIEKVVEDEKRIEIADLEKERLEEGLNTNFEPFTSPSITKTNLDRNFKTEPTNYLDYGLSLATEPNLSPDYVSRMRAIDALPPYQRPANNIFENLEKETANVEIDAGANTGKKLNPELPIPFPYGRSGGYNLSVLSSTGDAAKPNPVQGPPSPFFPDQITPTKRPFATTDEIALRSSPDGYYFVNASDRKLDIPERISNYTFPNLTEGQIMASDDEGYSFETKTNPLFPDQIIKKASLPAELQGIVSLNTDLDYEQTTPLNVLLENTPLAITARNRALKKEAEKKQKEIAEAEAFKKFRESLPSIRVGGGYRGDYKPVVPNYAKNFAPSLPPLY